MALSQGMLWHGDDYLRLLLLHLLLIHEFPSHHLSTPELLEDFLAFLDIFPVDFNLKTTVTSPLPERRLLGNPLPLIDTVSPGIDPFGTLIFKFSPSIWGNSSSHPSVKSTKLIGKAINRSLPSLSNHSWALWDISMYKCPEGPWHLSMPRHIRSSSIGFQTQYQVVSKTLLSYFCLNGLSPCKRCNSSGLSSFSATSRAIRNYLLGKWAHSLHPSESAMALTGSTDFYIIGSQGP